MGIRFLRAEPSSEFEENRTTPRMHEGERRFFGMPQLNQDGRILESGYIARLPVAKCFQPPQSSGRNPRMSGKDIDLCIAAAL